MGEERVMLLLLRESGERPVTAGQHRVTRQREDLFLVVAKLLGEMRRATAHRAREHRISDDGERPAEPGDEERRHPWRVAKREQRLHRQRPDVEVRVLLERLGARKVCRLKLACPYLRLRLTREA